MENLPRTMAPGITLRTELRPGDLGMIVQLHGRIYSLEQGFDSTFEAYVAGPLAEFAMRRGARERIWIVEAGGQIVGCVAIVAADAQTAQLRWFLVDPAYRGRGIGSSLLREAIQFARDHGYRTVFLWTVDSLHAAGRRYASAGFNLVEERAGRLWGVEVVEQRYAIELSSP